MVVKGGRVSFLLLLASLMMASSASLASDFVTGLVVGQALSNNNGSTKQWDDAQGDKEFVDFNAAQEVTGKEVWFQSKQWRREEWPDGQSRYFICPGNGEYRSYSGRLRCRVADTGFSGFVGGMKDAKELPLAEALAVKEGKPITLESLKVESRQLAVKYFIVPVKQTPVKEVTGESGQPTDLEQASAGKATTGSPVEAEKKPQGLNSLGVTSASDLVLEWLDSPTMKIIMLVITVAGVGHGIIHGNIAAALLFIPMALFPTVAKMLFFTGAGGETETPAIPDSSSGEGTPIFLAGITVACVIVFFVYRYYADRVAEERLEALLRLNRAAAQSSPPVSRNNEPPTIDTLRERQQQDNTSEPVVVSSSAATPRAPRGEPEDVQPGKRKIILD
ncbi:hypothetical protein ACSZNZ_17840 [Aeromonas caviae]|uniref:hypothetical protein n=1 Tax=Gammaproteobacteria TaxID=1236 RepID=UPI0037CDF6B4